MWITLRVKETPGGGGFFAWLVSLPQPIETAEQKREKPESLCTDSGQILFDFAGTNICRSKILDGRNSAARPKGVRTTDGVTTKRRTERQVFSARKRYSRPRRLFFAYFFLTSQKKSMSAKRSRTASVQHQSLLLTFAVISRILS